MEEKTEYTTDSALAIIDIKPADRTHRATINSAARDAIMSWGAEKELAQNIVRAISQGKIPHVKINY